jgi:hypothetical protein
MKKFLFFILTTFQTILVFAQVEHDTNTVIYSWQLENNFSTPTEIPIDSVLDNFQTLLPIYKISPCNSFLSNFGSPYISNVFFLRNNDNDFFFLNQYFPYLLSSQNTKYYNTKSAYSTLFYSKGGNDRNKEESFDAFVTQNASSKFNYGLHYNLISAKSQYKYLNVKKHSFSIFASYTGHKYMMHTVFNINRHRNDENGGINDSIFKNSKNIEDVKDIPVNFEGTGYYAYTSNAVNRIRYYDFLLSQRLKLFTISSKTDSSDISKKKNIAEPIVTYVLKISRSTKSYSHNPIASDFYDTIYFNPYFTYDSVANFRISNTFQLEFKTTLRGKVQAGVYGLLGNEYDVYSLYSQRPDSIKVQYDSSRFNESSVLLNNSTKENFSNTFLKAGLYTNILNRVRAIFSGEVYFMGPKAGQTLLEGIFDTRVNILKHDYEFRLESRIENKYPSYLLNNYISNHYIWSQTLLPENKFILSSKIAAPSNKFFIRGNYHVLRNLIYFNQEAKPVNVDKDQIINYFSIEVAKTLRLWKIYCMNDFIYQVTGNQSIIPLPEIVLYNSTYFDHTFKFKSTKGEFRAMLGVDIYYNTLFKGYNYSPALAQFYTQENLAIGNFPLMDAFLNIQLKRIRFFVKLQHFNSQWSEQNYYSAVNYPYNQMQIKFGLSVILSN